MGTQNLERGGLKQKRKQVMASERSRASAAPDPWLRFAVWAAPAAVALLAFVHTLPYKFVFDDEGQILRNPWIRDWSNLKTIFATDVWRFSDPAGVTNYYRPLHMLLYMLGYHVFGLEPRGYHALSILLHSLSTVLVTSIGLRLTGDRRVAVLGGLLFALHPVHAESVAWVAAVPDLLCAAFFFSALRAHLAGAEQGLRRAAAPLCFLGALLSKEMAFAFPAVAAWADL